MPLAELRPDASTLPAALVSELEHWAAAHEVAAGIILLRQRAIVENLIVLVAGRMRTLVEFTGTGNLVVETTEDPGRVFGWSGLQASERATATVRADTDGLVGILPLEPVRAGPPRCNGSPVRGGGGLPGGRTRKPQMRGGPNYA